MPRFFIARALACGDVFDLPENIVRHIRVLRLKNQSGITLFNGDGSEYRAELTVHDKRRMTAQIATASPRSRESPLHITLAQAVSTGERMDFTVQKCVELGVNAIIPLNSAHGNVRLSGERAARRVARWQEIAIAASEQCGRNHIVQILPLTTLDALLHAPPAVDACILLSPSGSMRLREIAPPPTRICLLAGAEGGLSDTEENMAVAAGFIPLRLGMRILRTETAAIAAVAALQTLWGDF